MPAPITPARRLRQLLVGDDIVMAPGAFSPIAARLVAEAGFPAVYLSGAGVSAALYGQPDVGTLTLTELADAARRMVEAAGIPLICDADTGFGNVINVRRTVQELEAAGVAAVHLEDQAFPKKCGYFEGHVLVEPAEMVQRIRAALEARRDADTLIIARTEALGARHIDETIDRACAYVEAGAGMIFVNGLLHEADVVRVAREIPGPQLYNVSTSGKTPHLHVSRLKELGFKMVIYPAHSLFLALRGIQQMLAGLKAEGTIAPWLEQMIDFEEWRRLTGVLEIEALERRYGAIDDAC